MKAFLLCSLLLPVISVTSVSAFEKVHVQASPDYRVALVTTEKVSSDEKACRQALGASLGATMSIQCGGRVNVRLIETDANRAVSDLTSGSYDAVMVVGENLPAALHKPEFITTRGVSEVGVPVRIFQLVVRNDDPSLQAMVSTSFEKALSMPRFVEALSRAAAMKVTANSR